MPHKTDPVRIDGPTVGAQERILTPEAIRFLVKLSAHVRTAPPPDYWKRRRVRQQQIDAGELPDFPAETAEIRKAHWKVAPSRRPIFMDRRVEITGPTERKMIINA